MGMDDPVLRAFLERQYETGMALTASSDLVKIAPIGAAPVQQYLLRFSCNGLVKNGTRVVEGNRFDVGIWFPCDYLRRADMAEVVTLVWPPNLFHPNVRYPFICVGRVGPGTTLVDLAYQLFEIITYHKVTMTERDALNWDACTWARQHRDRFPIDARPLRRVRPLPPGRTS